MAEKTKVEQAQEICEDFWGVSKSNGGREAFARCRDRLTALGLDANERRILRTDLGFCHAPFGDTHSRVAQLRDLLEMMGD